MPCDLVLYRFGVLTERFWEGRVLTVVACEGKEVTDEATIGACDVFITGGVWECTKVACEGKKVTDTACE